MASLVNMTLDFETTNNNHGGRTMYVNLFSEIVVGGLALKNRLTMAPLYLGYAAEGGGSQ
jgi:hypothetical protein